MATEKMSYVLAGKRDNQATQRATAAAKSAHAAAQNAADDETAAAYKSIFATLTIATAAAATAMTADTAKSAAIRAHAAATAAAELGRDDIATAAAELAHNALTVSGVYAAMDATASTWVSMRDDVTAARFERHATAKSAAFRLVVSREGKGDIYLTVNTTAAMDWRKIDAAYNKRLANQAAKSAAKGGKKRAK